MDASTTIKGMLYGNKIRVPNYQRAYSWDTPSSTFYGKTHTDVFLEDLENYINTGVSTPYYFGHFLFAETDNGIFDVIDGQQRLTTIIIFLSALFAKIRLNRKLTDDEEGFFENMIHRGANYSFSTVEYDDQYFKDYVVNQTTKNKALARNLKLMAHDPGLFFKKVGSWLRPMRGLPPPLEPRPPPMDDPLSPTGALRQSDVDGLDRAQDGPGCLGLSADSL